jgi:hypothetical protein
MKRVLLVGGGVIIVLVITVAYVLYSSLDSIIADAIEKYGSRYTGTAVAVDGVHLDLTSGKGDISGFSVANPAGFETPKAIRVGAITLAVDVGSVTSNPIIVKEIVIDKPKVTYEVGTHGNNIDALIRNVERNTASDEGKSAGEGGAEDDGGRKLIIENLYVRGGKVSVSATMLEGRTMTADLDNIHLRNIGGGEGGVSPEQVAAILAASLFKWVAVAIKGVDLQDIMKVIGDNVGGAPMRAKEAGELIGKEVEGAGKLIERGAGEAGKKLKKLFE